MGLTGMSWQDLKKRLEVPKGQNTVTDLDQDPHGHVRTNEDLEPTKASFRTWTWVHYTSFWLASSFATGTWTTGSAMIALGMPWYAAWLAVVVSHNIGAALLVANGRGPAAYHIGFPVYARASFGMWGSYFAITSRCIVVSISPDCLPWTFIEILITLNRQPSGSLLMLSMAPTLYPSACGVSGHHGIPSPTLSRPARASPLSSWWPSSFSGPSPCPSSLSTPGT